MNSSKVFGNLQLMKNLHKCSKPENNQKGNTNKTQNITKQTKTSKVKTGDDTALFMYSLMLLVALLGFMLVLRKKVR